jgi:hypothetical protein
MSKKIPFKISARTARLIGRQNFPNAEGAIIELVKNSYDADANISIVVFDNKFAAMPTRLQTAEYAQFSKQEPLISKYYLPDENQGVYFFKEPIPKTDDKLEEIKTEKQALQEFFQSKCKLYIIDNGEGMTDQIIEDYWMTIGTNNKEVDVFTTTGRVKTGAKGIGRFALDKLGDLAEMLTKPDPKVYPDIDKDKAFLWQVDWNFFEGDAKTLNQVEADLIDEEGVDFAQQVKQVLPPQVKEYPELKLDTFTTGTRIEIGALRDTWDDYAVEKLFTNLEVLIPPREERIFNIFLFSTLNPEKYGQVSPSVCDDYDYKVETKVDADGKATITIYRNEFDVTKFPDELFSRELMQKENFTKSDFERGEIVINRHIRELAPGLAEVDSSNVLENIRPFEFIYYSVKNQVSNEERKKFFYRDFNASSRKKWLDHFGGIKLFRDNFRVRPYGETDSRAFDWLLLGERAGRSPQSLGQQRPGSWRVRPNQISGIINISRLTNIDFEDTSSRYGLQENKTFDYFTEIIKGILGEFEQDRSKIGRELSAYYDETQLAVSEEKAQVAKREIRKNVSKRRKNEIAKDPVKLLEYAEKLEENSETLVIYAEQLQEQIEIMRNETGLLRILATNALIIASFTHELKNIKDKLVARINKLKELFEIVIDSTKIQQLPDFLNPLIMLGDVKKDDEKLKQWLHYSLETLRKDKRRRTENDLLKYFREYKESWQMACDSRGVKFDLILPQRQELKIRVFEADLDSIFNNLLINSFEAFLRKDAPPERSIPRRPR